MPLPIFRCGTWLGVARPVLSADVLDVQLLAVRFVDPGHPEGRFGPRYRVWFRNNSVQAIRRPFNVVLIAGTDERLMPGLPHAGVRVAAIEAGQIQSVDIRLPFEAARIGHDVAGQPLGFTILHILVDADRELADANMANNGAWLRAAEILPVDPAAFEVQPGACRAGSPVVLAGEGFGPESGKVLVRQGNCESEAEILGWYDLGVRVRLLPQGTAGVTQADLVVVRADGVAANPLEVTILP